MRNSSHPLIVALRSKTRPPPEDTQRIFEVKKEDIHPMAMPDIGDNLHMKVHGRVKSINDDGSLTMQIQNVEHQFGDENAIEAPKEQIVTTQQSHAP